MDFYKYNPGKVFLLYFVLFASYYNSVLRVDLESVSLYRLLVPLQFLIFFLTSFLNFKRFILFVFLYSFSGLFGLLLSTYPIGSVNLLFFSFYFLIFLMFFTVEVLYKNKNGRETLYFFLKCQFFLLLIIGVLNLLGVVLPNMEQEVIAINGVFTSENDYSLAIVAFSFVSVFYFKSATKSFWCFLIVIFISFYNDSKICLLFFLLYYFYAFFKFDLKINSKLKPAFLFFGIALLLVFMNWLLNYEIQFPGGSYKLIDLIIEPIFRILTLEPYGNVYGSVSNRTDLIIYGVRDFFSSFGLGIGYGNSLQMIETSKYAVIGSAKSMHNFPLQFLVELGVFITGVVVWFLFKNTDAFTKVTILFLLLVSLSQSVGVFSNYYFFVCFFFIVLLGKDRYCSENIKSGS